MGVLDYSIHDLDSGIRDIVEVNRNIAARSIRVFGSAAKLLDYRVQGIMTGAHPRSPGAAVVVEVGRRVHEVRALLVPSVAAAGGGSVGVGADAAVSGAEISAYRNNPLWLSVHQAQASASHNVHGGAIIPKVSHAAGAITFADVSHVRMYCVFWAGERSAGH